MAKQNIKNTSPKEIVVTEGENSVLLYNSNKLVKEQERMINDCNSYHDRIYEKLGSLKKYLS